MDLSRIPTGILTGKILIVLGIINCVIYPLIVLFWQQIALSTPMGSIGIQWLDVLTTSLVLYIVSSIGVALGIAALMTEDSRKAGKLAVLGGVLAGNFINWICLPLMIIGGVLCYLGTRPVEK